MKVYNGIKGDYVDVREWQLTHECSNLLCASRLRISSADIERRGGGGPLTPEIALEHFGITCPQCGAWNELDELPHHVRVAARERSWALLEAKK